MSRKKNEIKNKRLIYKNHSIERVGFTKYNTVWSSARDSIKLWAFNRLGYNAIYADHPWYLDSLVCFNELADRCVMALSYQLEKEANHDGMDYLYGAQIKGKWYFFFGGGHFTLPRDYYHSDIHIPLNIEQFNEIAADNIFRGYLNKNKDGVWEINDAFFAAHFEDVGWGDFDRYQDTVVYGKRFANKKEYFESIYLRKSNRKWLYKEKNEN